MINSYLQTILFDSVIVHSNIFYAGVVAIMLKYKFLYFVLNEAPKNNDIMCIANIVLNEAPNSNNATHVGNKRA